jgi:DNA polymerase-3 subunit delta'
MAFKDFAGQEQGVELLQRSLERGRLGHGYLFTGHQLDQLEVLARTLAKTLNCLHPVKRGGVAVDCCDRCLNCQKIEHGNHADVFWVRPESKLRQIRIRQVVRRDDSPPRVLLDAVNLKPTESQYKVAVIVAADRMNVEAANAFLKTLEEPPPHSVLILLTTEPQRVIETIRSRCLRLNFAGEGPQQLAPPQLEWLASFSEMAAADQKSLLGRYRLMDVLLKKLNAVKESIDETLTARSPLEKYEDVEEQLRDKWDQELKAAIEAEYRRQRADFLLAMQWWLRDVWVQTLGQDQGLKSKVQSLKSKVESVQPTIGAGGAAPNTINHQPSTIDSSESLLVFPQMTGTQCVAQRISPKQAMENLRVMEQLQRWLSTNVQEALALEVGLLKLHL